MKGVKVTVNTWGQSKGIQFCSQLAGNSSYRGFELTEFNRMPLLFFIFLSLTELISWLYAISAFSCRRLRKNISVPYLEVSLVVLINIYLGLNQEFLSFPSFSLACARRN